MDTIECLYVHYREVTLITQEGLTDFPTSIKIPERTLEEGRREVRVTVTLWYLSTRSLCLYVRDTG